jgi:heat shock protein HspQ
LTRWPGLRQDKDRIAGYRIAMSDKQTTTPAGRNRAAKFRIGDIVKHRIFPFRGVIFDVDPVFANTEEWYQAIPAEMRPRKDQPFYHLYAENAETEYVAYVSEQNLLPDNSAEPIRHPQVAEAFEKGKDGRFVLRRPSLN